jgi:hypothetical protein
MAEMDEQPQSNVPPRISEVQKPSARPNHWRRWAIGVVTISLVAVLAVLLFITKGPNSTPEHSIEQLKLAAQRHDREGVSQYVEAEAYAESARKEMKRCLHKEMAKGGDHGFFSTLLDSGLNYLGDGMIDAMVTPDSIVSTFCGETTSEVAKENLSNYTDQKINGVTSQGDLKTQAGGILAKCLVRGLISYAIDNAAPTNEVVSANRYDVTKVYERPTRYLIKATSRDVTQPSFGYVFRRYSYSTWKLSELRIYENKVARTEQASR